MIRSCDLILCSFFVGMTLSASAQQSTPAASAPAPLVETLAGHLDLSQAFLVNANAAIAPRAAMTGAPVSTGAGSN